jgi:hypothetical protein
MAPLEPVLTLQLKIPFKMKSMGLFQGVEAFPILE